MKILIVTPASAGSRKGNRVTALRWAAILRRLGHRVMLRDSYGGEACDVLIALHARRSAAAVERSRAEAPDRPVVLAMTGTDLYQDLPDSVPALRSIALATRIVVLQPLAINALPENARARARTIFQSALPPEDAPAPSKDHFDVCVVGHLREVKDPLRAALASRRLPASSRVRIVQLGAALEPVFAERARAEASKNPRYVWLGDRPRREARRIIAASQVLVVTSRLEGGGNVISEALACGVPVLATKIDGAIGNLGEGYPGYFPVGDEQALAELLLRCERDPAFHGALRAWCERLRPQVDPARELDAWRRLLNELDTSIGP